MRRLGFVLALLLVGCGGGGHPAAEQAPDGSFGIATVAIDLLDASRPTAANGTAPGSAARTLHTTIYYPDAPVRFPLIVFAHGLSAVGPIYSVILRAWAAEGYVVAAPDFPLSRSRAPGGSTADDYMNQPGDLRFVIDEMLRLDADPDSALHARVDAAHIGAAGQSLGGLTTFGVTLNSCCRDPRIAAAVPMAGLLWPFSGGEYEGSGAPPTLVIHGDADDTVPYAEARTAYDILGETPKALLTIEGGGHILPYVGSGDRLAQLAVIDASTAFFDLFLKRERGARARLLAVGMRPRIGLESDL